MVYRLLLLSIGFIAGLSLVAFGFFAGWWSDTALLFSLSMFLIGFLYGRLTFPLRRMYLDGLSEIQKLPQILERETIYNRRVHTALKILVRMCIDRQDTDGQDYCLLCDGTHPSDHDEECILPHVIRLLRRRNDDDISRQTEPEPTVVGGEKPIG